MEIIAKVALAYKEWAPQNLSFERGIERQWEFG